MSHPDSEDPVLAEIRQLHADILRIRHPVPVRHGWVRVLARDLETNPDTQYNVHRYGVYYWLVNFPLVTLLFFLDPSVWLKWGIFITLVYSIYANLATDYGAMSAAMAARGQAPLPPIPVEPVNGNGGTGPQRAPGGKGGTGGKGGAGGAGSGGEPGEPGQPGEPGEPPG